MNLQTFLFLAGGVVLLIAGAEAVVRGASRLAAAVGISPLVVGLTVVAFGTSSPELAVSVSAGLSGSPDIALGNVVGSNIFNVLFILGVAALITPLVIAQQLVRMEVLLVIGASVLVLFLGLDGRISRLDGLVLFTGILAYTVFAVRQSLKETAAVQSEYEREFGRRERGVMAWVIDIALVVAGLAMLVLGSDWLVGAAVSIAGALGVSELIIALTIVAVGTSLPEVATSVIASIKGERDIAVGNVIGSSLFNLLAILGVASLVSPEGIRVPAAALRFDIPVMIAVSVACLPVFYTGYRIARWEGALFLAYYVAYTAYLILQSAGHETLPVFNAAMGLFVLPLTAVTLAVLGVRAWRARHS